MPLDAVAGEDEQDLAAAFRQLTQRLRARPRSAPPPAAVAVLPPVAPMVPEAVAPPLPVKPQPPDPGESAAALLDIIWGAIDLLPQERALVNDALLLLVPRLTERQLISVADRLSGMDAPPPLLAARLIRDPRFEVAAPLLERNAHLSDRDIMAAAGPSDSVKLRIIARRRSLSPQLSSYVAASGDLAAVQLLLRNPGAELFFSTFMEVCELAVHHAVLQVPLTARADLPLPAAFELFWCLPPELRRVILSRFLTDSVTLNRIIAIITASELAGPPVDGEAVSAPDLDAALAALTGGRQAEAVQSFARLAGLAEATAQRILADVTGEPLAALLKALGISRAGFMEVTAQLRAEGWAIDGQASGNLQAVFDGLSGNKARTLLIYWDWFTRKAGPYAPQG